jgi:hypothetical protein
VARRAKAGAQQAMLRTPLLSYKGGAPNGLSINADASKGSIIVRVLNAAGQPIAALQQSQPVDKDGLAIPIAWDKPLSAVGENPFFLEFVLTKDAEIYGFSFQ